MSSGEREALASLLTTLIAIFLFVSRLRMQAEAGAFDGPDALQVWARSFLLLAAIGLVIAIFVAILFNIAYSIVTGEKAEEKKDERDHLIERRGLTVAWYLLSIGIMGVIINLALGSSALMAMNLIMACCAVAEISRDLVKLYLYRHGS